MLRAAVITLLLLVLPSAATAEKRVALVIGNSAYQHTAKLTNPKNDAVDMGAALRKHGFQVIDGFDLDKAGLERKVREFARALGGTDVGVLYYAGHGLQVAGVNYLVPIDAKLDDASGLDFEMVRLDLIQRAMERESKTNILFLDACRDNPLARNLARAMGTRSAEISRGLAAIESGIGTLISFSTQPGNVALDGTGRNSPFAGSLVKHISAGVDDLGVILIGVRNDVMRETQRKQVPWEHSALTGRFYFKSPAQAASASSDLPMGLPPQAYPVIQAGGLFTEQNHKKVYSFAEKHRFKLADFQIEVPGNDVSAALRRFVGVWIEPTGNNGKGRKLMLIVTRVNKDGKADGYWLFGPPAPTSFNQHPAGTFRIEGMITGDTLRFTSPVGDTYKNTLTSTNRLEYLYSSPKGQIDTRVFNPLWTLVEAERSAKR